MRLEISNKPSARSEGSVQMVMALMVGSCKAHQPHQRLCPHRYPQQVPGQHLVSVHTNNQSSGILSASLTSYPFFDGAFATSGTFVWVLMGIFLMSQV